MNYHHYQLTNPLALPADKKIVLVGGCFDILHFGHIQFLHKAQQAGNYLVIALEPDERIINYKKRMPIHFQEQRAHNLLALRAVNCIVALPLLHGFDDYLQLVKDINPQIIAITYGDPQTKNKQRQADIVGAQLIVVNKRIEPFSSSAICTQKTLAL